MIYHPLKLNLKEYLALTGAQAVKVCVSSFDIDGAHHTSSCLHNESIYLYKFLYIVYIFALCKCT